MQRYFARVVDHKVLLDDGDVHHVLHVMRCHKSDEIEVVDSGTLYLARIDDTNPLSISIVHPLASDVELSCPVTLLFPLAKGDKIDFVIQKATELGVSRIILVNTKRCVVKMNNDDFSKKQARFSKILKEASEQSHRLKVPEILGVYDIDYLPKEAFSSLNLVAYEKLADVPQPTIDSHSASISYLVGPEGGFEESEIAILKEHGFLPISLGKRILRCETAAIYGLSVIGYCLEK